MTFRNSRLSRRRFAQASAGVVAGSLAAPVLAGAQQSHRYHPAMLQSDPVSGKVLMWVYPLMGGGEEKNEEVWAEIVASFNEQHPDVEVTVELLPWAQRNEKLTTALAAGAGPDVGYLNDDFIPQHGGDGNLQALDEVIGDEKADFTENSISAMSVDGTLYALPILGSATSLVYNQKIFDEVGVTEFPTTWDEMLELGPTFKDAGYFLTAYDGALEQTLNLSFYPLLWQAGGEVLNEDQTAAAFNDEAGLATLNFIKTLYDEGFINQEEAVTPVAPGAGSVVEGKVAIVLNGDAVSVKSMQEKLGADAITIGDPLKNKVQVSYGTSAGFGVFKDAQDPDAAKAWVKYITGAEAMEKVLRASGFISPRTSLQGMWDDDPVLSQFEKHIELMHGGVRHKASRQINASMAPYIQAGFLGDETPEDALAASEEDVNRLIERG
jgi:multiple sugar transport system substrate-binding protein